MRLRKQSNRKLYESIMNSVSKEVKKEINESSSSEKVYGVFLLNGYEGSDISMFDLLLYKSYGDAKAAAFDKLSYTPKNVIGNLVDETDDTTYTCHTDLANYDAVIDIHNTNVYVLKDDEVDYDYLYHTGLCYILTAFDVY